jgi:recX family
MKITDKTSALNWATTRCAQRECCRYDLEKKLRETPLSREEVDEVLDTLEDEHFIDAGRYARAFAHDKLEYDGWGRLKISQALRQKKFSAREVETALAEVIEEAHYLEILQRVLASKIRTLSFDADDRREALKATQKLVRFAASRGFEPHLIFDTLHQLQSL